MPAYINTFARATNSAKPWWGVGQEIDPSAPVEEWLTKTGLDYKVQRRKAYMHSAPGSEAMIEIPGYHAITRSTDGHVFQIASDGYTPIQNKEIAEFFKVYTEAGEMTLETMGSLKDGGIVWGLAKTANSFTLPGEDRNDSYLLLATSHDGSMSFCGQTTVVRVVCWNTLSAALAAKTGRLFRLKHTKNADVRSVVADAHAKLKATKTQTEQLAEVAQKLASATPTRDELDTWLYRLTQPTTFQKVLDRLEKETQGIDVSVLLDKDHADFMARQLRNEGDHNKAAREIQSAIVRSPGSELESAHGTWWGAVNGVTYFADHIAGQNSDDRLQSAWFGSRANMKENAVDWALEYAHQN
jgi:phage/plasmid-like protein (TIGR03299 family)